MPAVLFERGQRKFGPSLYSIATDKAGHHHFWPRPSDRRLGILHRHRGSRGGRPISRKGEAFLGYGDARGPSGLNGPEPWFRGMFTFAPLCGTIVPAFRSCMEPWG